MSKRKAVNADKIRRKCRRRIIIPSSSSEDEFTERLDHDENITSDPPASHPSDLVAGSSTKEVESNLNVDILALLGDAPQSETTLDKPIHKDIATRWHDILVKGLQKEPKAKLLKEYLIPSNCEMLLAPKLNAEIKAAMTENLVKRDSMLETKQNQIGIAVAALLQAMNSILEIDFSPHSLVKPISDACRILADSRFNETKTRRHFIISSINSQMKDTMNETVRDKYLFGENISEKLKSAKSIKKSGTDLRPNSPVSNSGSQKFNKYNFIKYKNQGQENWKPLQRKSIGKADAATRPVQHQPCTKRSGVQQWEAVDRMPAPRQRSRWR